MDFVWQRSSHGNQTIEVGPYTSEPQAISELRKKMKKDLMNTNIIQVPNPQDVSNMSQITRVYTWVNGAQGAEIAIKTEKKNGKWYASLHIPGGVYHITFYE
jgi:superfamily II RNA helicase